MICSYKLDRPLKNVKFAAPMNQRDKGLIIYIVNMIVTLNPLCNVSLIETQIGIPEYILSGSKYPLLCII